MHKRWKSIETLANPTEDWSVHGSAPAVVAYGEGGKRIWSYEELSSCVCQIAAGLRRKGIGKNDLILLISENSPEWIACCLAVLTAGATIVPIDASTDERTLTSTLKNLKVRLVFTSKENSDRLERLVEIPHEDFVILDNGADDRHWKNLLAEATDMQVTIEPEMVAAIFFTSGTTGTPKGVPLTHGNLAFQINSLASIPQLVHDDDRVLLPLPLHHIYPFVIGMLLPLACGRPIILPGHLTGTHLMKVIRSERVTAIIGVPRLYEALLAGIQDRLDSLTGIASIMRLLLRLCIWCRRRLGFSPGRIFLFALHREIGPDLKTLTCGGASIDPDLAFALVGFGWRLAIGYGLSETSPLLTLLVPGQRRVDTVGRPLKGVELKIAKFKSTRDEGRDSLAVAGEILARGPGVFSGYLPDPGGIPGKEVFTEDGWFHTGDLGFMEEGYLKIAGRASCVIISRTGKKIDPEILEASYSEDPFISEIGILSYEGKLVSVVVPDLNAIKGSGYHSIQTAVHNAIDRRSLDLPSYKRLSGFRVCRKPLERTTMGKIQRHHLATLYRELSQSSGRRSALAQEAPMTESDFLLLAHPEAKKVYEYLADRYGRETLNLDASVQLDLGIDSLEWLTLQLAISDKTGVSFDESDILKISTVRDLMRVIAGKEGQQDIETRNLFESPEKLLNKGLKHWLEPLSGPERIIQYMLFSMIRLFVKTYLHLKVEGLSNIVADRQYVFIPNHASYLDAFVLGAAMPEGILRKTHWAGWTGIAFANDLARIGSRMGQVIPIDAENALISSLALPAAAIKSSKSLVWFPEGRRTLTGELLEFKKGIALLLNNCPVSVIPVFLKDTGSALPPGSWLLRPVTVTVRFGAPQEISALIKQGTGSSPEERIISAIKEQVQILSLENPSSSSLL